MPAFGDLFTDVRGGDRTMRLSYHEDRGVVVVSLWAGPLCRASFRLPVGEVGRLIDILRAIETSAGQPGAALPPGDPAPHETGQMVPPDGPAEGAGQMVPPDQPAEGTGQMVPPDQPAEGTGQIVSPDRRAGETPRNLSRGALAVPRVA